VLPAVFLYAPMMRPVFAPYARFLPLVNHVILAAGRVIF
jgi:hypothetical protein